MVKYKVRSFYENDTGTAGADVLIFDDEGDKVDTLLITTESTYNDLIEQIEGIDEKYLDRTEVLEILQNTTNEIVNINATLLNGHSSDYFAVNNHNHDRIYAPISHINSVSSPSILGHTKIINNCTSGAYRDGEALAAYQGKVLQGNIDALAKKLFDWQSIDIATYDDRVLKAYVNPNLRIVFATFYDFFVYKTSKSNDFIATGEVVKSGYRPKRAVHFASHTPYTTGKVDTDGKVYGKSTWKNNKDDLALYGTCWWVY